MHLSKAASASGSGVARVERLGPMTLDLVSRWLERYDLDLLPTLDLDDRVAVDAYETPDRTRERVLLRNPCGPRATAPV